MSGGSGFNEVFFTDVGVPDEARLGEVGQGWQVALTTLGFERAASGAGAQQPGGSFAQVAATARQLGRAGDPLVRQMLADLYVRSRGAAPVRGDDDPARRRPVLRARKGRCSSSCGRRT